MSGTEQVEIRSIAFPTSTTIAVTIKNTGTSAVTIQEVWLNNVDETSIATQTSPVVTPNALPRPIAANGIVTYTITLGSGTNPTSWTTGDNYQIKVVTAKGNVFMKNALAA